MHLWPKKPPASKPLEQFVPPPLGHWELECSCGGFFPVRLGDILELDQHGKPVCPACVYVNGLSASAQDFILEMLK